VKSFVVSLEYTRDKDDWRLRLSGQLASLGLPGQ